MVGHDLGAYVGWHVSLFRPDRVKALVALSAPYFERSQNTRSPESFRQMFGEGCYLCQFQVHLFIIFINIYLCGYFYSYATLEFVVVLVGFGDCVGARKS